MSQKNSLQLNGTQCPVKEKVPTAPKRKHFPSLQSAPVPNTAHLGPQTHPPRNKHKFDCARAHLMWSFISGRCGSAWKMASTQTRGFVEAVSDLAVDDPTNIFPHVLATNQYGQHHLQIYATPLRPSRSQNRSGNPSGRR